MFSNSNNNVNNNGNICYSVPSTIFSIHHVATHIILKKSHGMGFVIFSILYIGKQVQHLSDLPKLAS